MWATRFWRSEGSQWLRDEKSGTYDVRVLVQEIPEGVPFKAGDRVRTHSTKATVVHCFAHDGLNWVAVVLDDDPPGRAPLVRAADRVTRIPPETSRLIRVTGPQDYMENALSRIEGVAKPCRVEVVDG